jgi:hypothetical protein
VHNGGDRIRAAQGVDAVAFLPMPLPWGAWDIDDPVRSPAGVVHLDVQRQAVSQSGGFDAAQGLYPDV